MSTIKYKVIQIVVVAVTYILSNGVYLAIFGGESAMESNTVIIVSKVFALITSFITLLITIKHLDKKYPNTKKQALVSEKDERNISLRNRAYYYAGNTAIVILVVSHLFSEVINPKVQEGLFIGLLIQFLSIGTSLVLVFYKNKD